MNPLYDNDYAPDAFEVRVSDLLVATPDQSDDLISNAVPEVLRQLREHLRMDVVFVSEFVDGRRVFRRVDTAPGARVIEVGESAALEHSFCQRVVDGRLPQLVHDVAALPDAAELPATPFPIGAHLSTPVVLNDGRVYGTLCCFSFAPNSELKERDLNKLRMSARLTAKRIDEQRAREAEQAMANWSIEQTPPQRRH
ncbi:GAF domain-containing protein [Variovorax dokdonensis]|uniref:GAF domain-containing protein n=1 Tax=Variovorax dokdonensis TaxID=344883 RepID=A0ABT7NB40_9BURK|nr:GAF domain-containing protein [Variovorax dokdonensis]MDM0045080.1 GAF domain-containing protein [Variovorax dokdonensis]